MQDIVYWIWLSLACTPGTKTFATLLEKYSDAREIYEADDEDIVSLITSRSPDRHSLADKDLTAANKIFDFCTQKRVGILTYGDEKFPKSLKTIPTPPVLLYYRGVLPDFDRLFTVAIVGTRRLSQYGRRNAFTIAFDLARAGATVVSGMAHGIDSVAHAGALAADKITIAVLGSGIDVCYPAQHQTLAREIVKQGCVFTEYPPGTKPEGANFPVRNRIISGLSNLTLVIEGRERSGAMITARHAAEQNRPVYALPGNVGGHNSELTNLLIKNGATLCTSADDIVRDFEMQSLGKLNPFELARKVKVNMNDVLAGLKVSCVSAEDDIFRPSRKRATPEPQVQVPEEPAPQPQSVDGFDKKAIKIYQRIPFDGECTIESLIDSELPLREVMKGLLKLEMLQMVVMLPGERVRRKR
ncbi:MAG: DNA-processing protein DprA [Clostridia bacterium]|nr:DNA-processing protein DprA [Clostridia bacterium]